MSFVPEVYHWNACRGDWLILACDGIWDTISNQQAVDRICKSSGDIGEVLESVLHFCIEKEADDNLTLLAIELGSIPYEQSTSMSAGDFLKTKDAEVWWPQNRWGRRDEPKFVQVSPMLYAVGVKMSDESIVELP